MIDVKTKHQTDDRVFKDDKDLVTIVTGIFCVKTSPNSTPESIEEREVTPLDGQLIHSN